MIGCFPPPHPDELFYSICARYGERVRYSSPYFVLEDLFGTHTAKIGVDLPTRLDSLVAALPPEHPYTVDRFIDEHSLLPFYRPFVPIERYTKLRQEMGADGASLYGRLGLVASSIDPPKYLRLCSRCVAHDRIEFGEAYWHRIHQLPGLFVCPQHECVLGDTTILRQKGPAGSPECFSAEYALKIKPLSSSKDRLPWHNVLLALAKDAAWLLNQRNLLPGYQRLKQLYRMLLKGKDLTDYRGLTRTESLHKGFQEYYSDELLDLVQCPLKVTQKGSWPLDVLRVRPVGQHPLRHLLVIHFLGETAASFFALEGETEQPPFGRGPWPCLNPVCEHYNKLVIQTYKATYSRFGSREPLGYFACACGFEYWRKGRDQSSEDKFRADGVSSRGPVWEEHLRKIWMDSTLKRAEKAELLGVCPSTLGNQVRKLDLPRSESQPTAQVSGKQLSRFQKNQQRFETLRSQHRAGWLSARKADPEAGMMELRVKVPGDHSWLKRNDWEWLQANKPPPKKGEHKVRVDWEARDRQRANEIRMAASVLRNKPGRPVRISLHAIGQELGQPGLRVDRVRYSKELPLTIQAIDEVMESRTAYAVRKIWWAAQCYSQEHIVPARSALGKRAMVGKEWTRPEIQAAVDSAMHMLASTLSEKDGALQEAS